MSWKSRAYLALLAVLMASMLAVMLTACAPPQATPTIPERYHSYWSETLGIAFEYPPEAGITEYPAYGGFPSMGRAADGHSGG